MTRIPRGLAFKSEWGHRRSANPLDAGTAEDAVRIVLDEYGRLKSILNDDESNTNRYGQSTAQVKGAFIVGSAASGRMSKKSDVDVWLWVEGLTDYGYKYLDQHIKENLEERDDEEENGKIFDTEANVHRTIDLVIKPTPLPEDYSKIPVELSELDI